MNNLESVKKILDSDSGFIIEDISKKEKKEVIDNRFSLIKQSVEAIENKDDNFYFQLIKLIGNYIDPLYDKRVDDFPNVVFDKNGEEVLQDYTTLSSYDMYNLTEANKELANNLFEYVCTILENNKDVKLDIETLKKLLNRNPKLFDLSVEEDYLFRPFNFNKLVTIINENKMLEKSNINIDDIYQLLLDTYQINNDNVFGYLVKPEQFNQNHKKIEEVLTWCNAKTFAEITNIIRRSFDKDFDRFSIIKKRNKNKFCEELIIELLRWRAYDDDCSLVHQILTDPEIEIDYDLYSADFAGETDLKSIIALSNNKTIIKDLLSKEQNIQKYYRHGGYDIGLYTLYAIVGDYEKAIANFEENYNFKHDLCDLDKTWDKSGYAYGDYSYHDSLARFIKSMCNSFKENNVDYSNMINLINRIINSEKVKYINLEKTLIPIQKVLSDDDFKLLVDGLLEKHNSGNLEFITVNDYDGVLTRYRINIASENEIQEQLETLKRKEKNKILSLKPIKKDD